MYILYNEETKGGKREQSEERCDIGGPPAVCAYSSLTMGSFRVI